MFGWFLLGVLGGVGGLALIEIIMIQSERKVFTDEDFVKKLVEKKGWTEARWELETSYKGKYMRIWRKLYRKHIEGGEQE